MNEIVRERNERVKWHQHDRFGMFIHWGIYSIPARGEWVRSREEMSIEEYNPFIEEFTAEQYNPKEWARIAKEAGMKYAVLTAKHHDGFCLYDSKLTDYKSTNAPCKRDLVKEFLEAFRAEGIKVGLYYSIIDWHHPDFPHYGDKHHPSRNDENQKNDHRNFDNYLTYMHGQVRELLTHYGKLDLMWYDFSYDQMRGDMWKSTELMTMVRELQPHLLTDNRLEGSGSHSGSILTESPSLYAGDFASPEQMIPLTGVVDTNGNPVPWESCLTLNNHWAYASGDNNWKSAKLVIESLVNCISKGGNLLLNVGPTASGEIPAPCVDILKEVGNWLKYNGDSIYGCTAADYPKPEWGRYTQNGNKLYAHIQQEQVGAISLVGLARKVEKIRLLHDKSEIKPTNYWNLGEYLGENVFFFLNSQKTINYPLSDARGTVVEITLKQD